MIWKPLNPYNPRCQLILTGVEHAIMPEFQQMLIQLEDVKKLGRIVVDKVHTVITQRVFRGPVRKIPSIVRCVSVPLLLLTASLPPEMEDRVRIILGCEEWRVIRLTDDRPEIKYIIKDVSRWVKTLQEMHGAVWKVVERVMEEFSKPGKEESRGLIYCLTKSWTKQVMNLINEKYGEEICGQYHVEMLREERNTGNALEGWKSGDLLFLAATSALGAGIDCGEVRVVIHEGYARSLIDLCQESERGGRDGLPAESITVFAESMLWISSFVKEQEKREVLKWIKREGCLREGLNLHRNGTGSTCVSDPRCQFCSRCEDGLRKSKELRWVAPVGVERKRGREQMVNEVWDGVELKEMIKTLRNTCSVCWVLGKKERDHDLMRCR